MSAPSEFEALLRSTPSSSRTGLAYQSLNMATPSDHDKEKGNKLDDVDYPERPVSASGSSDEEEKAYTLYERKCKLINAEIEALGMGRYQWCLWALCGLGYMIDLLWAQAFNLVLSPM
ncbi:hypothetical protein BU26DRAFT_505401 [Trematosphaeria pertusa]|uniref:MFS general substrate transporter n=1 Tax=Trematosphaeria pertusa TaxID=390896 RepID=A0A6A6IH45_9PLEO|nr:uncharacterized protein BU26DRAFT_505401 [Trematosphaeria pertusa]KAF2249358.1 hypothetical protein BU26DRAFT_505401 [Trematosphaeria pertusa]